MDTFINNNNNNNTRIISNAL